MATLFDTTVTAGNTSITSQGNTTSFSGFIADTGGLLAGATTIGSVNDTNISTINSNWTGGLTLAYERTIGVSSRTYFGGKAGGGGDQRLANSSWDNIDIGSFNKARTAASFVGASSWGSKWYWSGSLLNANTTFINVDDGVVGDSTPDTPNWGSTANETPLNTYATSDLVTISGMDTGATTAAYLTVAITGDGGGTANAQYKFNSSPWITINSSSGTAVSNISNGDEIQFRSKYSAINTTVKIKFASTGVPDTFFTMNTVDALAPTISSVGEGGIELASETVTVNLSNNGQGGTGLYYAQSDTNSLPAQGSWQTSNEFSHPRGTTKYYWANRYSAGTVSLVRGGSASFEKFVDYLDPDTSSIAGTNDSILWAAITGSTTVSGVLANHTYIIKRNNGSYRRSAEFTANGAVTIGNFEQGANGTPPQSSSASTLYYEFVVRRNTNAGGEPGVINATTGALSGGWTDTNRTFSITREKDPIIPVITVTGGTATIYVGDSYTDAGATATDNFAPATPTVVVVNPVNTSVIGVYTVTYNATDTAGNAATQKTRTVNVVTGILGAFNTNQTGVELSSTNYAYAQYTGSTNNVLAARTVGTGTFAVTANATQPNASLFTSAEKNIANGKYLHVKQIASSSYSTGVSSTYRVGGPGGDTSVHTVTTRAEDNTPSNWAFSSSVSGSQGATLTSSSVTLEGMLDPGTLTFSSNSIASLQMNINSGGWVAAASVAVSNGTTVVLRGTAPVYGTNTSVVATIGQTSSTLTLKSYPQTPTAVTLGTDPGTNSATATFAVTAVSLLGANTTTITKNPNYTSNTISSGGDLSIARSGTSVYVRNTGANGLIADAPLTTPAIYLLPNTPSLPDISNAYNTASHLFNITSMPTTVYYEVRTGGYTGTQRGVATTGGGDSTKNITVTQTNTGNDTVTYYVRGYRLATAGGDEHWDNLGTYTVTEAGNTAASAFTFNPNSPVGVGLSQISNLITIAGLSPGTSANFSITGGTYSKNGAPDANTNGTAVNGDTFRVKHTSSSSYSTSVTTTLTVGGTSGSFVSTTGDITPTAFSFTDKTGNASTEQNSYAQITGINLATTVSRTSGGATFAVVGTSTTPSSSNFGTSNTTITNNQYLHVKQTTSSTYNAVLETVMNVGGITDTWVVTTNPAPSDGTPENYSFTDVTTALSTVAYAATQITGISQTITVSRTSGAAVFAISNSGTTTPNSSGFTSSNKTLTNNQYIWLRQTSSSSNSTTLTSQFSAGGVSASWNLTTVAASGSSGTGYGLQIFPPTGTIARLDTTDRTVRALAVFTGTLAAGGSSSTFTQTGYSSSDTTIAVEWQTSGDPQYVSLSSSGTSLTITRANDPSSFSNTYQVRIFRV